MTPQWFKRVAIPLSNKVVYASDAYVDLKSTLNRMTSRLIDFDTTPVGAGDRRLLQFAQLLRPRTNRKLQFVRVGGQSDGGYVMADDFQVEGALSIGVGSDVSWDMDISRRGIPLAMFDPTIRHPPQSIDGAEFFRLGLGRSGSSKIYLPLTELIQLSGFNDYSELLLKIDVEGDEWESLEHTPTHALAKFRQIVIEYHDLNKLRFPDTAEQVLRVMRLLDLSHVPIHIHANNYDRVIAFDSYWFPNAIEVTYLRKDILGITTPATQMGEKLDRPCDPRVDDISLEAILRLP